VASIIERIDLGCASNLMRVLISLTAPNVAQALRTHGLAIPLVQFADTVDAALEIILVEI
jgi:hypothetical protein